MFLTPGEHHDISELTARFERSLKDECPIFLDSTQWIDLMEHYMSTLQYEYAIAAADTAGDIFPASVEVCVSRAEVYLYADKREEAVTLIDYLDDILTDGAQLEVLHGMYHATGGDPRLAIEHYLSAYDSYEDRFRINVLLGDEYSCLPNYGMAIKYYQRALTQEPNEEEVLNHLVAAYISAESYTLAVHFLEKLTQRDPYNATLWHRLGFFHMKRNDYDNAIRAVEYATYIKPSWSSPYYDLAEMLFEQERYEEAIKTIRRLLSHENIDDPFPYSMLGKCYHQMGAWDDACEYFLKAIHYDPQMAEGWYNLASVHFSAGFRQQALEYIRQGIEVDASDIECLRLCWEIEESLHMWDEALRHLTAVVDHPESLDEDYMDLAYFLYERGQYRQALMVLQDMRAVYPDTHEVFYHMAANYFALADTEKGLAMFKKAISLASDLLHIVEDNYPELIENIPSVRHYIQTEKTKK